ncbi:MAG: hypothetical protein CML03_00025 [Pseudooceanicola sp.]|nr:hypothetical protein [Pseudooceanicola sp.]
MANAGGGEASFEKRRGITRQRSAASAVTVVGETAFQCLPEGEGRALTLTFGCLKRRAEQKVKKIFFKAL